MTKKHLTETSNSEILICFGEVLNRGLPRGKIHFLATRLVEAARTARTDN